MFDKIMNLYKNSELEEIYFTGCFDTVDQEFVISKNYLFIEFDSQCVCFEATECYSKLKTYLTSSIVYNNDIEDMIDGKIGLSDIIFVNPFLNNKKIKKASFVNLKKTSDYLICDVFYVELFNGELIFLDPSFFGIQIGGMRQKEFWLNNLSASENIIEEKIDFDNLA